MDTTYLDDDKLFLYWHQRLSHYPQKYIRRLDKRGVILRRLEDVTRIPMCAACKLSDTSKRNWKGSSYIAVIREKIDDKPRTGILCNHLTPMILD